MLDGWHRVAVTLLPGVSGHGSPVADALVAELDGIVDSLVAGVSAEEPLSALTRILAVQELPPSRSLSILSGLRPLLADELDAVERERLGDRIEKLTLQAFDRYMHHREVISQLKVDEGMRRMHMALRRAEA